MESCSFKLGVGLNIPLQENTKLKICVTLGMHADSAH